MLLTSAAYAQEPTSPSSPPPDAMSSGSPEGSGAPTGASDIGAVSNETTTTTTTTTTDVDPYAATAEPLPNTGGEPLLLSMLGSMVAGGAFFLRRKIS
jgi:LPXTG-motif cell wall-anchored protein